MGISFRARHPQDACAFYPPHNVFQDFAGQAQKALVAVAVRPCGAAAKGILVLVPLHDFRTHGGGLEKRSPCPDI